MFNYIVRRVLLMFPTLLGMTLVTFLIMGLSPAASEERCSMGRGV